MTKLNSASFTLASIVLILGLSACSSSTNLPTMHEGNEKPTNLESAARDYQYCMSEHGIELELLPNDQGVLTIAEFSGPHMILYRDQYGSVLHDNSISGFDQSAADAFFASSDDSLTLIIDGIDYSNYFQECLFSSGYDSYLASGPQIGIDRSADIGYRVQANNIWASCAREHGFPMIADCKAPTVSDGSEWPSVSIPPTMTEKQLLALLAQCPNFDPEQAEARDQWIMDNTPVVSLPEAFLPDPIITIEWNMPADVDPNWEPTPEENALMEHVGILNNILASPLQEYYKD